MRLLVCGGRDFTDRDRLNVVLDHIHDHVSNEGVSLVIHGGARGADQMAGDWARSRGIPIRVFKADWVRYESAAGMIRNRKMLEEGDPDMVVAFPTGGPGTIGMMKLARAKGLTVQEEKPL